MTQEELKISEININEETPKSPVDMSKLHKLQDEWTLWYDMGKDGKKASKSVITEQEWMATLKVVNDFNSVEDFWTMFNDLLPASKLKIGASFYLFKKGIRPEWEDEANNNGGRWHFTLTRNEKQMADGVWLYLAMSLIGGTIDREDDICGLAVAMRDREFRVSLWMKNTTNLSFQHEIGKEVKKILNIKDEKKLYFRLHEEDKKRSQTNLFTL